MSITSEINRIKTNIANAYDKAEEKGATMPAVMNSSNLADTIDSITGGSDEWKPQPDWWDIDTILENDAEDYTGKMICLIPDSFLTTTINRYTADKIVTSDGTEYGTSATSYNHTWDISKDKLCNQGYKTRYIIWYFSNVSNLNINGLVNDNTELYIIIKNLNFTTSDGNAMTFNRNMLECIKMINCTRLDSKIRYNGDLISLKRIIGFNASNVTNLDSLFYGCLSLSDSDMNQIIKSLDWSKITNCSSMFRSHCPLYVFPDIDTSNVNTVSYMFDNANRLKNIENLNCNNFSTGINSMFLVKNLISIKNISNIKTSGFNFNGCPKLNHDTLIRILNALADYSESENTYTITLGSINLAKLTSAEIAIGTNKNWTIS